MWSEKEMEAQTNEAQRAEAALYLFTESIHTLESSGWVRERSSGNNPWYWWRNDSLTKGLCTLGAALRYEHARQDRIKPLHMIGDND